MGNSMARAHEMQRVANKKFTDPKTWEKPNMYTTTKLSIAEGSSGNMAGAMAVMGTISQETSHIDADKYFETMSKIEEDHQKKSSLKPGEVTNALRSELYQQRQYLSYKDTMQRLGVPESSILSIERWEQKHKAPPEEDYVNAINTMADRESSVERFSGFSKDPNLHDLFSNLEEGDNRFSERMLREFITLKSEGKLCAETAGRELNRDSDIIRRVTDSIRIPPPSINFDSNLDTETMLHMSTKGHPAKQAAAENIRNIFRFVSVQAPELGEGITDDNHFGRGYYPENLPSRGFRPPSEASRSNFEAKQKAKENPLADVYPNTSII